MSEKIIYEKTRIFVDGKEIYGFIVEYDATCGRLLDGYYTDDTLPLSRLPEMSLFDFKSTELYKVGTAVNGRWNGFEGGLNMVDKTFRVYSELPGTKIKQIYFAKPDVCSDTYNFAILRHSQEAKRESFWKKIKKLFVNIKN